jgi:uncharacterized membrane protein
MTAVSIPILPIAIGLVLILAIAIWVVIDRRG